MPNPGFIYGLFADTQLRYIGQSTNPAARFASLTDMRKPGSCGPLLRAWLYRNVGNVQIRVLEQTEDMDVAERRWIATKRIEGIPLLNIQDGGREKHKDCAANLCAMKSVLAAWKDAAAQDVIVLKELIRQSEQTLRKLRRRTRRQPA